MGQGLVWILIYRGVRVSLDKFSFLNNLVMMVMSDLEIILGMDWMKLLDLETKQSIILPSMYQNARWMVKL